MNSLQSSFWSPCSARLFKFCTTKNHQVQMIHLIEVQRFGAELVQSVPFISTSIKNKKFILSLILDIILYLILYYYSLHLSATDFEPFFGIIDEIKKPKVFFWGGHLALSLDILLPKAVC